MCRWGLKGGVRGCWSGARPCPGSDSGIPALSLAHTALLSPSPLPQLPVAAFPCCVPHARELTAV